MKLVVDANILFSALVKDGKTSEMLCRDEFSLYSSDYILEEFEEHRDEILKKSKRNKEDFDELMGRLKKRITFVSLDELVPFVKKAEKITPDTDDMIYIALALKLKIPIWSNDRKLKEKQNSVKVYNTEEVIKL